MPNEPNDKRDPMATASCHHCNWKAAHKRGATTEDDLEIAKSLRRLLLEHVRVAHPELWSRK